MLKLNTFTDHVNLKVWVSLRNRCNKFMCKVNSYKVSSCINSVKSIIQRVQSKRGTLMKLWKKLRRFFTNDLKTEESKLNYYIFKELFTL